MDESTQSEKPSVVPLPAYEPLDSLLATRTPGYATLECFLPLTKAYDDDATDEKTRMNRALYFKLGIEEMTEKASDLEESDLPKVLHISKTTSYIPFHTVTINVPLTDIFSWFGGRLNPTEKDAPMCGDACATYGSATIRERRKHPLYRMIIQRLCRGSNKSYGDKMVTAYGVSYRAVKAALGLTKYSSMNSIITKISNMMGGLPKSMIVLSVMTRSNDTSQKRKEARIFPSWTIPFLIACLPAGLRRINRPPAVVCMSVIRDMVHCIEKGSQKESHPLVSEMTLLEEALTYYTISFERDLLTSLLADSEYKKSIEQCMDSIRGLETIYHDVQDDVISLKKMLSAMAGDLGKLAIDLDSKNKKFKNLEQHVELLDFACKQLRAETSNKRKRLDTESDTIEEENGVPETQSKQVCTFLGTKMI
jgi:hypothetical protein